MSRRKQTLQALVYFFAAMLLFPSVAFAQYCSTTYCTTETFFGTGGDNASSTNYQAKQTAGELGVGNTSSTNYQANAGFNTTNDPYLEFTVNASNIDFGVLSTSTPAVGTATFSVRNYLSNGYAVRTVSDPPTNGAYILAGMSSAAASSPGTEQFGINLVANTSPSSFGANPVQVPDGTFSFGAASAGYNTANLFKYVKGDTVAQSSVSSGQTNYTVSYLINIGSKTAGGTYTMNHTLVATGTY
jgi:hypothetical protein